MNLRRVFTYLLLVAVTCICISCNPADKRLFVANKVDIHGNSLFGYTNAKGDTIVKCIYPFAYTDTITEIGFVIDDSMKIKCFNNKGDFLFYVFTFDNGPDYPQEGLFRIIDAEGQIGFADTMGNVTISPQYKFAFPFKDGKAKVTCNGKCYSDSTSLESHSKWLSSDWYYISREGKKLE